MPKSQLSRYSVKIKDVYVELKDYKFFHSPYHEGDRRFIGRKKAKNRIISILKNTDIRSGAYLITGFRGMGKTSTVREAIRSYNQEYEIKEENKSKKETFLKRLLGYAAGFLCLYLLSGNIDAEPLNYLITFGVSSLFYFILYLTIKVDKNISNSLWVCSFIFICIIIGMSFYFEIHTYLSWIVFATHCIFLLVNYTTLSASQKTSDAVWYLYKIITLLCLFIGFSLFFYNPVGFCESGLNCNKVKTVWMNSIFSNIGGEEDHSAIFRILLSVFLSYCILSLIVFVNDLVLQVNAFRKNIKEKDERERSSKRYQRFEINLSQESLNELDVLRRMTLKIEEYWRANRHNLSKPLFDRKIYFLWRFILSKIELSNKPHEITYESVLDKLCSLKNRMSGQVTSRQELKLNPNITTGISKGLTRIAMPLAAYK